MTDATAAGRRSGVRVLGLGFLAVFIALCVTAFVIYLGWHKTPEHWELQQQRIGVMTEQEREAVSQSLFNRILDLWSASPPDAFDIEDFLGQRTTIEIPYHDLNVWIAHAGPTLLEKIGIRLPPSVKGAMVDSPGDGLLRITCDLEREGVRQILVLTFDIAISDDGTVTSTLKSASIGGLRLPTQGAIDLIAKRSGDNGGRLADMMRGEPFGPIVIPIDPTDDGLRDGMIVAIEARDDAVLITRESVRRRPAN